MVLLLPVMRPDKNLKLSVSFTSRAAAVKLVLRNKMTTLSGKLFNFFFLVSYIAVTPIQFAQTFSRDSTWNQSYLCVFIPYIVLGLLIVHQPSPFLDSDPVSHSGFISATVSAFILYRGKSSAFSALVDSRGRNHTWVICCNMNSSRFEQNTPRPKTRL